MTLKSSELAKVAMEGNRISSLEGYRKQLKQEHGLLGVFCYKVTCVRPGQSPPHLIRHAENSKATGKNCLHHYISSPCWLLLLLSVLWQVRLCECVGNCDVPRPSSSLKPIGKQSRAIEAFVILTHHHVDGFFDGWHLSSFYCPPPKCRR